MTPFSFFTGMGILPFCLLGGRLCCRRADLSHSVCEQGFSIKSEKRAVCFWPAPMSSQGFSDCFRRFSVRAQGLSVRAEECSIYSQGRAMSAQDCSVWAQSPSMCTQHFFHLAEGGVSCHCSHTLARRSDILVATGRGKNAPPTGGLRCRLQ